MLDTASLFWTSDCDFCNTDHVRVNGTVVTPTGGAFDATKSGWWDDTVNGRKRIPRT